MHLKNEEDIVTDYLGPGSIIGQYSMFDKSEMVFGFRCIQDDGCTCVVLKFEAIDKLCAQNQDLRKLKDEVKAEHNRENISPVDFLVINRNAKREVSVRSRKYRLLVFQRLVRRLQLLMGKHEEIFDFVPPTHTLISQLNGKSEFFTSTMVMEALKQEVIEQIDFDKIWPADFQRRI
jgi:CRP-like cAMP-binding protein